MAEPDFKLNDDGTVTVRIGDKTHRLRRPTIGQLRVLTESQRRLAEASAMMLVKLGAIPVPTAPDISEMDDEARHEATERYATERIAEQAARNALDDEYEAQVIGWSRDALVRLSDHREDVPEADELPGFCLDRSLPVRLLNHWRTVPLAPGE